jgi:hypothetical protein
MEISAGGMIREGADAAGISQWRNKNAYLPSARVEENRIGETDSLNRLKK